jgi:chromosome segregation ATPase
MSSLQELKDKHKKYLALVEQSQRRYSEAKLQAEKAAEEYQTLLNDWKAMERSIRSLEEIHKAR